jgi:molecular chaperone GrpE
MSRLDDFDHLPGHRADIDPEAVADTAGPDIDPEAVADTAGPDIDPEAVADTATDAYGSAEDLARERDELRALAQRVQADFENYRKRVLREQTALVERAAESLIEQLLPVLDNFELALLSLEDADEKIRKGVELVYADFISVLERQGLERIDAEGVPFDPEIHEAVLHDAGGGEPKVVETMRTGYRLRGRVLRPAMVKVAG